MSEKDNKKSEETLKALRVRVELDLERIEQDLENTTEAMADESNNEDRSVEAAAMAIERDMDLSTEEKIREMIDSIDTALLSIKNGTYGTCESCGETIPDGRLEIVPYTTRCVECQRRQEK
jgi:RNA polymerase-binding protein DksA